MTTKGCKTAQVTGSSRGHLFKNLGCLLWRSKGASQDVPLNQNARYRPAEESDALDLVCLVDMASRGLASWFWSTLREPGQSLIEVGRNRIRTKIESPLHYKRWTVAEINGVIAGGLAGRLIPIPYERGDAADLPDTLTPVLQLEELAAGFWYLNVLAVYPEFRGLGLGSALLRKGEEITRATGAWKISIIVEEANTGALKLYVRHGFFESARRAYIPFPGSTDQGDWILLQKQIEKEATLPLG